MRHAQTPFPVGGTAKELGLLPSPSFGLPGARSVGVQLSIKGRLATSLGACERKGLRKCEATGPSQPQTGSVCPIGSLCTLARGCVRDASIAAHLCCVLTQLSLQSLGASPGWQKWWCDLGETTQPCVCLGSERGMLDPDLRNVRAFS